MQGPKEIGDVDTEDDKDEETQYEQWKARELARIRCTEYPSTFSSSIQSISGTRLYSVRQERPLVYIYIYKGDNFGRLSQQFREPCVHCMPRHPLSPPGEGGMQ